MATHKFVKDDIATHPDLGMVWVKSVGTDAALVTFPGVMGWMDLGVKLSDLTFVRTMDDAVREMLASREASK